jgi:subtilisin family serine protease
VAPESGLYVASVIESETLSTSLTRVVAGLNWLLRQFTRPDNEHLPSVLSMSLGFPQSFVQHADPEDQHKLHSLQVLLRTLIQANVLPIIAIGNDGPGSNGYPGALADVLAVGAVNFEGKLAPFSGSGPVPVSGIQKPDLVGYGVGVNSSLERDYSGDCIYQRLNGTSMATPYVAGIAALYRSLNPTLTVKEVWAMLLENALPLPKEPVDRVGKGLARFDISP